MVQRALAVLIVTALLGQPEPASAGSRRAAKAAPCEVEHRPRGARFHANLRGKARTLLRERMQRVAAAYRATLVKLRAGLAALHGKLATEAPAIRVAHIITDDPDGPYGAKEAAEGAIVSAPPSIVSAIHDAIGVWITSQPVTPEKILKALKEKRERESTVASGKAV